jgi:hypothetical protein
MGLAGSFGMGIFRKSRPASSPAIPTTGRADDDMLLAQIASRSQLDAPRHWVHYVYFNQESDARTAAEVIAAAGWQIQRVDVAADGGPQWVVIAEQHQAVTSPSSVQSARLFFEGVAATNGNGEYDGWEASV